MSADRNLLFGVLALQNNFIDRHALVAAFERWLADKSRTLGEILVELGNLDTARRELLDVLVVEHLKQHGGGHNVLRVNSPWAMAGTPQDGRSAQPLIIAAAHPPPSRSRSSRREEFEGRSLGAVQCVGRWDRRSEQIRQIHRP